MSETGEYLLLPVQLLWGRERSIYRKGERGLPTVIKYREGERGLPATPGSTIVRERGEYLPWRREGSIYREGERGLPTVINNREGERGLPATPGSTIVRERGEYLPWGKEEVTYRDQLPWGREGITCNSRFNYCEGERGVSTMRERGGYLPWSTTVRERGYHLLLPVQLLWRREGSIYTLRERGGYLPWSTTVRERGEYQLLPVQLLWGIEGSIYREGERGLPTMIKYNEGERRLPATPGSTIVRERGEYLPWGREGVTYHDQLQWGTEAITCYSRFNYCEGERGVSTTLRSLYYEWDRRVSILLPCPTTVSKTGEYLLLPVQLLWGRDGSIYHSPQSPLSH